MKAELFSMGGKMKRENMLGKISRPGSFIFRSRQTALWYLVYTPLLIVGPPSFVLPIVAAGLVTLFGVQREEVLLWVIGFSILWPVLVCHYAFRGDLRRIWRGEKLLD